MGPSTQCDFEVGAYYKFKGGEADSSFPWRSIWQTEAPLRVALFTWTAALHKTLTMDGLRNWTKVIV
jgi:hypothetical protein